MTNGLACIQSSSRTFFPQCLIWCLAVLVMVAGCQSDAQDPGPVLEAKFNDAGSVTLEEVAVVGEETGLLIGDPASVAVDSAGRVYVADSERARVWVLAPDGDSVGVVGREGRGPGEFVRPSFVHIGPHDSLFVLDGTNRRVSVFGSYPERAFAYSFHLKPSKNRTPSAVYSTLSGALWAMYARPKNPSLEAAGIWMVQVNREGDIVRDNLVRLPLNEAHQREPSPGRLISVDRPFGRKPVVAPDTRGRVCYGWTDSLAVRCKALDGTVAAVIDVEHEPLPVLREEIEQRRKNYEKEVLAMVEEAGWHRTYPAFEAMAIDRGNRFWVREPARADSFDDVHPWHVIDVENGTFRSTTIPAAQTVQAATTEYVYTTLRPIRPEVWVYRIRKPS